MLLAVALHGVMHLSIMHRQGAETSGFAMRYVSALLFIIALAVSSARAEPLPADTPSTTSRGATFTAPLGWSVTASDNKRILDPPEGDSHLALIDVQAAD